jgi:transposase
MAHARRHVVEVASSFPAECRRILETLGTVYRHDAEAREPRLSPEARLAYHHTHSGPVLTDLHEWLTAQLADHLVEPNSSLGQAITYLRNHWTPLTLFLRQPGAPLDNNICDAASGISQGMPPTGLCRAMRMAGWIERISTPTIVADAA